MSNFLFFIGSDISKAVIDVSFHKEGSAIYLGQFPNSVVGYKDFIRQLSALSTVPKTDWFICFENTGMYSKPLLSWLLENIEK